MLYTLILTSADKITTIVLLNCLENKKLKTKNCEVVNLLTTETPKFNKNNCKLLKSIAANNFYNVPYVSLERVNKSLITKVSLLIL